MFSEYWVCTFLSDFCPLGRVPLRKNPEESLFMWYIKSLRGESNNLVIWLNGGKLIFSEKNALNEETI